MKTRLVFISAILLLPVNVQAGISTVLSELEFGACKAKVSHDAVAGDAGVIDIRSRTKKHVSCTLSASQATQALAQGLEKYKSFKKLSGITSVFLGRLQSYPWMREYLIETSKSDNNWNTRSGKPKKGSSNAYVNKLLNSNKALKPFAGALDKFGYRVTGVSCEKILINKNKLPYDAMCWINIK